MLCVRVSVGNTFLGLVHKGDKSMLRSLIGKFGLKRLTLVPVIVL